jgi:Mg-chelatase subunit ChlD
VDCVLTEWTEWKPCTKACGGGSQRRIKTVMSKARGAGTCPTHLNAARYERQPCNSNECPPDAKCKGKLDIVFVVDSSGSWTEKGYGVLKQWLENYVQNYDLSEQKAKIGVVEFSKEAHTVQPLTHDKSAVEDSLKNNLKFRRGLTDMAKGLLLAEKLLENGRKDAQSQVIVLTDGQPSFKFGTKNAAKKLTRAGVRLIFMPIRTYGSSPFLLDWASSPGTENVFRVQKGLAELEEKGVEWERKLLVSTCPSIRSPLLDGSE